MPYTIKDLVVVLREYYTRARLDITDIHRREIAFERWNDFRGPSLRPVYFQYIDSLSKFLIEYPYAGVYASTGYYLDPNEVDMNKKTLMKTDLVFDLDMKIEGTRYEFFEKMCKHTKTLIHDFLIKDFGISPDKIKVEFSGNKGFHVTVDDEDMRNMDVSDRRQMIDYIMGLKVDKNILFSGNKTSPVSGGWRRHADNLIREILSNTEGSNNGEMTDYFLELGIPKNRVKKISGLLSNARVRNAMKAGHLNVLYDADSRLLGDLKNILLRRHKSGLAAVLDRAVTVSTHRLFRVPGSIHRKSGLPCINLEIADLESPDFIFEKIIQVVGEDPVEIELGHDIVLDLYEKETLSKGTYTMPRWKAIPALLIEKKNMQT